MVGARSLFEAVWQDKRWTVANWSDLIGLGRDAEGKLKKEKKRYLPFGILKVYRQVCLNIFEIKTALSTAAELTLLSLEINLKLFPC